MKALPIALPLSALLAFGALSRSSGALAPDSAQGRFEIQVATNRAEIEIHYNHQRVLLYVFASNQFKPYVKELYTLRAQNVLRDAPPDHLHHHGLMYAIRVNGVNFWEETGEPGHEKPIKILSSEATANHARFSQLIHWTAHGSETPLLIETRTLSVSADPAKEEIALDWQSHFQAGVSPVKLTGSGYNGLGLRLPESFDHIALQQNSEALPYTAEAKWNVTPAHWSAVTGRIGAQPVTLALFETPSNPGQTRFFTMLNPFAYLSVTQNLEKAPLDCAANSNFSIRYLLTVSPGEKSRESLAARYRAWLGEAK